jgi:hypothetical protein
MEAKSGVVDTVGELTGSSINSRRLFDFRNTPVQSALKLADT